MESTRLSTVIAGVSVGIIGRAKPKAAGWQNLYTAGFIGLLHKDYTNDLDRLDYLERVGQAEFSSGKRTNSKARD